MGPIVPAPDALPLPAPIWLLRFLLLFTFVLHLVPMNFLLGGSILAVISRMKSPGSDNHARLAARIAELLPVVIAFTVTLGVAPLLFVQVLYGQWLYSSSVLIGRWWFAVIPLVITAYYGAYLLRFRRESASGYRVLVAWLLAIVFLVVAFIYSNNMSLMIRPEAWAALYHADPGGGGLNTGDRTLLPRYLHMVIGAVAVSGVWVLLLGLRGRSGDGAWSSWAVRYGIAAALLFPLLVLMILMRHLVRSASLAPFFGLQDLPVVSQWSVFFLFAVTLVVGLAVLAWLVAVALRAGPPKA